MKLTDKIFELVEPTVKSLGYELYEVEYQKEFDNWVLTLYIESPNGVSIDDCELVSNAVDPILDEADPIEQAYYLSVSSLGIDRPLKTDRDYARNVGNVLDVKLYAPLSGKKELTGTLKGYDKDTFTIELNSVDVVIERKKAALIRPHISF